MGHDVLVLTASRANEAQIRHRVTILSLQIEYPPRFTLPGDTVDVCSFYEQHHPCLILVFFSMKHTPLLFGQVLKNQMCVYVRTK